MPAHRQLDKIAFVDRLLKCSVAVPITKSVRVFQRILDTALPSVLLTLLPLVHVEEALLHVLLPTIAKIKLQLREFVLMHVAWEH